MNNPNAPTHSMTPGLTDPMRIALILCAEGHPYRAPDRAEVAQALRDAGLLAPDRWEVTIEGQARAHYEAQRRAIMADRAAALAWLEKVGSWPSSDADVRELTRLANRKVGFR